MNAEAMGQIPLKLRKENFRVTLQLLNYNSIVMVTSSLQLNKMLSVALQRALITKWVDLHDSFLCCNELYFLGVPE